MFDFLKKIFGDKSECTDCENVDTENTPEAPTFPIPEIVEQKVEVAPEVLEQPSLKMNMPTATNPTVDTPIEEVVETPTVEEYTESVTPTEEVIETPTVSEPTEADTPTIAESTEEETPSV